MSTLAELYTYLGELKASRLRVVQKGQNYSLEGVSQTRAELTDLDNAISRTERDIENLEDKNAGRRVGVATPKWT